MSTTTLQSATVRDSFPPLIATHCCMTVSAPSLFDPVRRATSKRLQRIAQDSEKAAVVAWTNIERARRKWDVTYQKALGIKLAKVYAELSDEIEAGAHGSLLEQLVPLMETEVGSVMEDFSLRIAQAFGRNGYNVARRLMKQEYDPFMQEMIDWSRVYSGGQIRNIAQSTRRRVAKILAKAVEEGWSPSLIKQTFVKSNIFSRIRAMRIARTEVTAASNAGTWYGTKQIIGKANFNKSWLSARDLRVRESHGFGFGGVDGQTVDFNKPFKLAGGSMMWPGDPSLGASASEIVNCRCTYLVSPKPQ